VARARPMAYGWLPAATLAVVLCTACASLPPVAGPTPEEVAARGPIAPSLPRVPASVRFLVMGDSGHGDRRQYEVAATMAWAHVSFPFDLAIMLGDNLYGREDRDARVRKFERPYAPLLEAGVEFRAALGNHDSPEQRFYEPFHMGGRRYYAFRRGEVEFFVLDSTDLTPAQVSWLALALDGSTAPWKIAFFHHPLYSSGKRHGPDERLRAVVEPLFVRHGVSLVLAGHEHFYERMRPQQGITYIIQGAAGRVRRGNIREGSPLTAHGFDTDRSFTLVEIVGDELFFETVSVDGRTVDAGTIRRRAAAAPLPRPPA